MRRYQLPNGQWIDADKVTNIVRLRNGRIAVHLGQQVEVCECGTDQRRDEVAAEIAAKTATA